MRFFKIILLMLIANHLIAQKSIKILTEKKGVSLRGLSIPNEQVIWASGSKGTVVKSVDGGVHFDWMQVKGYENRDFRSIHAWNEKEAVIVAIASPGTILKTTDGGLNWDLVTEIKDSSIFLDAIHFKDENNGWIVGDPIHDTIILLSTKDRGASWQKESAMYFKSKVKEGEAFFASSSTNMNFANNTLLMVSGGMTSRLWINGEPFNLPIIQGSKTTGANSMAIAPNGNKMIIVGGDFTKDTSNYKASVSLFKKNKKTQWELDTTIQYPNGYRSCVEFIDNDRVIACGTSGVDYSQNGGQNWNNLSNTSFHVVKKQPNSKTVFLAGSGGRIGYLSL